MDELESRPRVTVRKWMEPHTVGNARLTLDFASFSGRVRRMTQAGPTARLYWFDSVVVMGRQKKLNAESFAAFSLYAWAAAQPVVMVYDDALDISPLQPPAPEQQAADAAPTAFSEPRSTHSRRSADVQRSFRDEIKRRHDGQIICALCGNVPHDEQEVDAAHIVPHGAVEFLSEAGLVGADSASNGVFLCKSPCHFWCDRLHWWLDSDGKVAATDALLSDPDEAPFFLPLIGKELGQPREEMLRWYPTEQTWAVQRRRCEESTAKRHEKAAAYPFECERCGVSYKAARNLKAHVPKCEATKKRLLFTPKGKGNASLPKLPEHTNAYSVDGDNDGDATDATDWDADEPAPGPLATAMSALALMSGAVATLNAHLRRSPRLAAKILATAASGVGSGAAAAMQVPGTAVASSTEDALSAPAAGAGAVHGNE